MKIPHLLQKFPLHQIAPFFIILFALALAGLFSFISFSLTHSGEKPHSKQSSIKPSIQPTAIPEETLGVHMTALPSLAKQPTVQPTTQPNQPTITPASITSGQQETQMNVPQSTQFVSTEQQQAQNGTPTAASTPTVPPTPAPVTNTVTLEIKVPNGSSNFTVPATEGMNVCAVLQKAKDEGKLSSVTFDDAYMDSLKSLYVVEINGYQNNWTFTVNGTSPLGCSLSHPKPNDIIVWKFG